MLDYLHRIGVLREDLGKDSLVTLRKTAYDSSTVMDRDILSPDSDGTRNTRLHKIDSEMAGTSMLITKNVRRRATVMLNTSETESSPFCSEGRRWRPVVALRTLHSPLFW